MKIVHFTSVHPLDDARVFAKQCCSLAELGHQVTLIGAGAGDYKEKNVNVKTVPKYKSRIKRILLTCFSVSKLALTQKADIYHFHDPELIPFALIMRLLGNKVVFDAHEDLSLQVANKQWLPKWLRAPSSLLARILYLSADKFLSGIVTVTPTIIDKFKNKNKALVRNFPRLDEFLSIDLESINERDNALIYVGGLTKIRGISENIDANNQLPDCLKSKLIVAGNFQTKDFEKDMKLKGGERTEFMGRVSRSKIVELMSQSKIGLVTLHPTLNYYDAYPVKMFEYMAAGLPVISSNFPVYSEIVRGSDCGLVVDPESVDDIKDAISELLSNPEQMRQYAINGRKAAIERYNWANEVTALVNLYHRILG